MGRYSTRTLLGDKLFEDMAQLLNFYNQIWKAELWYSLAFDLMMTFTLTMALVGQPSFSFYILKIRHLSQKRIGDVFL
jgi:hypothetical protein